MEAALLKEINRIGLDFKDLEKFRLLDLGQLKQKCSGFFGVGTALKHFEDTTMGQSSGFYDSSLFFKTLVREQYDVFDKIIFPTDQHT
jgi:phosphoenolpyruvate carboxylase